MKFKLLTFLLVLINLSLFGQNTITMNFDNIIAVTEETDSIWKSYYLTKAGKVIGRDSLEYYDNFPVCESEGFICFRDHKTDKAGMFNRNGDIVIPAKYNYLSQIKNGMAIGRIGATKHYIDKNDEHGWWEGGKVQLIDTTDKILVDDFNYTGSLNFYSLIISDKPNTDSTRVNFKSVDGKNYSFVDFEKEFKVWLKLNLLDNFTKNNLFNVTFSEVAYWQTSKGWLHKPKEKFIDRNFELIKTKLLLLNSTGTDYGIGLEGLNPFISNSKDFKPYFNNCGESKDWIYPAINIYINNQGKDLSQDNFEFLRTDNGYKLIAMSIKDGEIK